MKDLMKMATAGLAAVVCVTLALAQDSAAGGRGSGKGGGKGGPAQLWFVEKTTGGVYKPPMRPLWKLSDLKAIHAGQSSWQEQIILDPEQDATYNGAVPGTKFTTRAHPDTPTVFVVIAGNVRFTVEGQPQSANGRRGSIVNIMKSTNFSYEVAGDQSAYWVEVNPTNYKTAYPADGPAPKAVKPDGQVIKVSFNHTPALYTPPNQLEWNTFDDGIAKCVGGARVLDDHLFASPLLGYVNPADNKCGTGSGNIGSGPAKPGDPPFNPKTTFGHLHAGPAEWWIVQVGAISGKFENTGEFHAVEGDVLYAAPMMWHQMAAEAMSGPSVRLAMGGYQLINMTNTTGATQ
jgi:mannose-6-phosphate isomerase-like protein (cupin superfamily)